MVTALTAKYIHRAAKACRRDGRGMCIASISSGVAKYLCVHRVHGSDSRIDTLCRFLKMAVRCSQKAVIISSGKKKARQQTHLNAECRTKAGPPRGPEKCKEVHPNCFISTSRSEE